MNRLRNPATCVVAVGLAAAGVWVAGPFGIGLVAGGLLSGAGSHLLADITSREWERTWDNVMSRNKELNHDLQRAYQDAFANAAGQLKTDWFSKHPRGRQQRRTDEDASAKALFNDLQREAKSLLDNAWLDRLAEDAESIREMRGSEGTANSLFHSVLSTLLVDEDPQLSDFLRKSMPGRINEYFEEELKRDDTDGVKARTAYQILIFRSGAFQPSNGSDGAAPTRRE